jgi:hypothetical protein
MPDTSDTWAPRRLSRNLLRAWPSPSSRTGACPWFGSTPAARTPPTGSRMAANIPSSTAAARILLIIGTRATPLLCEEASCVIPASAALACRWLDVRNAALTARENPVVWSCPHPGFGENTIFPCYGQLRSIRCGATRAGCSSRLHPNLSHENHKLHRLRVQSAVLFLFRRQLCLNPNRLETS